MASVVARARATAVELGLPARHRHRRRKRRRRKSCAFVGRRNELENGRRLHIAAHVDLAGGVGARAGALPALEHRAGTGSCTERHVQPVRERRATRAAAIDPRRRRGDGSRPIAGARDGQGVRHQRRRRGVRLERSEDRSVRAHRHRAARAGARAAEATEVKSRRRRGSQRHVRAVVEAREARATAIDAGGRRGDRPRTFQRHRQPVLAGGRWRKRGERRGHRPIRIQLDGARARPAAVAAPCREAAARIGRGCQRDAASRGQDRAAACLTIRDAGALDPAAALHFEGERVRGGALAPTAAPDRAASDACESERENGACMPCDPHRWSPVDDPHR